MQDIEGPLDAVVGNVLRVSVIEPGGEYEKDRRKDHRGDHHQLQQPNRRLPGRHHRLIISRFNSHDEGNSTGSKLPAKPFNTAKNC